MYEKRILAFVLATVTALGLVACGNTTTTNETENA